MILMSALPPTADIKRRVRHVRYVPTPDIGNALEDRPLVADYGAGKAHQDRREDRIAWALRDLTDGRDYHSASPIRRYPATA